ncbi:GNAT family N-acetyltransferase [Clostridium uliginosum]|uniref:Phosphinothricin acetyltransferase n=1 Tax=Clostridium uliginosum TaxID=119641 RepID=A0A1I1SAU6_9CLOT|nr:GNAT family N-acetyltransferase [Clostridium uliginosum]SFD40110.1 phosphinothricin acetyltransferase [Clostridium uliginosum]
MSIIIDEMKKEDFKELTRIYEEGIKTKISTFQNKAVSYDEWNKGHIKECRLVARSEDKILGWAALSKIFSRQVYDGFLEISIYIDGASRGKGIGKALLNSLINESEKQGIWSLQSLIIRENIASIQLHKNCGFREVGYWKKPGSMLDDGTWHDVVIMEKRSEVVGVK